MFGGTGSHVERTLCREQGARRVSLPRSSGLRRCHLGLSQLSGLGTRGWTVPDTPRGGREGSGRSPAVLTEATGSAPEVVAPGSGVGDSLRCLGGAAASACTARMLPSANASPGSPRVSRQPQSLRSQSCHLQSSPGDGRLLPEAPDALLGPAHPEERRPPLMPGRKLCWGNPVCSPHQQGGPDQQECRLGTCPRCRFPGRADSSRSSGGPAALRQPQAQGLWAILPSQ